MMQLLASGEGPHVSLVAEEVFKLGPFSINNSLTLTLVTFVILIVGMGIIARFMQVRPRNKFSLAVESVIELLVDTMATIMHSREKAIRFAPFVLSLFFFILLNNWLGLLPGVGSITIMTEHGAVPLFRAMAADLNGTLALAIFSVILTQVYAVKELGALEHLKKYFSKNPVLSFVGILEIFGELSKVISLSFRLFGNVFAGEVLLIVISYITSYAAPVALIPFMFLEIFVGFIQALVFSMLTIVFLSMATVSHSDHGDHEESTDDGNQSPAAPKPVGVSE